MGSRFTSNRDGAGATTEHGAAVLIGALAGLIAGIVVAVVVLWFLAEYRNPAPDDPMPRDDPRFRCVETWNSRQGSGVTCTRIDRTVPPGGALPTPAGREPTP